MRCRESSSVARKRRTMTWMLWTSLFAMSTASGQSLYALKMPDFRGAIPVSTLQQGEPCNGCGRVQSVREVALERKTVPATFHGASLQGGSRGVVDHNLVGAVVYLPLSSNDKPLVGGVGTPEMRERFGESTYAITVRLDDGTSRVVHRADGSRYHTGDRVRLTGASDIELVVQ